MIPNISLADVFAHSSERSKLDQALQEDTKNSYYRGGFDYNAFAQPETSYQLRKENVFLGYGRYNAHQSLKSFILRSDFNQDELQNVMQTLEANSPLLIWQYSSPTLADLYKHLDAMGRLQMSLRYHQFQDLEQALGDPLVKLRQQAVMDCLKGDVENHAGDIDLSFQTCLDKLNVQTTKPYQSLEDPSNGIAHISGSINVTDKVLDRVNDNNEDLSAVKEILPTILVSKEEVRVRGPVQKSRQLIAQYRKDIFLPKLEDVLKEYKSHKTVDPQKLSELSVFGVPMTEGQIRNIAMLNDISSYLAMNKIASQLAYLKAMDQYIKASEMLNRVMAHPAIESGYKTFLQSSADFVLGEIVALKEEKERLGQYADIMRAILDEADSQRLKSLALIKDETLDEQQKGLLKINP